MCSGQPDSRLQNVDTKGDWRLAYYIQTCSPPKNPPIAPGFLWIFGEPGVSWIFYDPETPECGKQWARLFPEADVQPFDTSR